MSGDPVIYEEAVTKNNANSTLKKINGKYKFSTPGKDIHVIIVRYATILHTKPNRSNINVL